MRREKSKWIYWAPHCLTIAVFTVVALAAVFDRDWAWTAVGVIGALSAAASWWSTAILRERIDNARRQNVQDTYKIGELEAALRRARAWHK